MKKKNTILPADHFDVADGLAGVIYSKRAVPVDRYIHINEENGDGKPEKAAFHVAACRKAAVKAFEDRCEHGKKARLWRDSFELRHNRAKSPPKIGASR